MRILIFCLIIIAIPSTSFGGETGRMYSCTDPIKGTHIIRYSPCDTGINESGVGKFRTSEDIRLEIQAARKERKRREEERKKQYEAWWNGLSEEQKSGHTMREMMKGLSKVMDDY